MTQPHAAQAPVDFAAIAAEARNSVVGVVSPFGRGSGYVALPNGLVVTSLHAVGYAREALIERADGQTIEALVIRANVALDVALVLPRRDPANLPKARALQAGLDPVAPGSAAVLVGAIGGSPYVVPTSVLSVDRELEGFVHLEIDAPIPDELRGAPLLDRSGRVVGFAIRPRSTRATAPGGADRRSVDGLVLPTAAFEGGLQAADRPLEELLSLPLEYGCPRCDTVFEPTQVRCLDCGSVLPTSWATETAVPVSAPAAPSVELLRAIDVAMHATAQRMAAAKVGRGLWRIEAKTAFGSKLIEVRASPSPEGMLLRASVGRMPAEGAEALFRQLLRFNDDSRGRERLGVLDEGIYLTRFEPRSALGRLQTGRLETGRSNAGHSEPSRSDLGALAVGLAESVDRLRTHLGSAFQVEPE